MNGLTLTEVTTRFGNDGPSDFQIETFIVDQNGVTLWGKFKQVVAELNARLVNLENMSEAGQARGEGNAAYEQRRRRISHLEGEIVALTALRNDLWAALVERHGSLEEWTLRTLEAEHYMVTLTRRALLEKSLSGTPTVSTMEAVLAMPPEDREKMSAMISMASPAEAQQILLRREIVDEITDGRLLAYVEDRMVRRLEQMSKPAQLPLSGKK